MADKTVAIHNRWIRITVGLFFMGVAIYYKEWMPALFGSIFIIQEILNRGCNGECYTKVSLGRTFLINLIQT